MNQLLNGKKGLILGVLNKRSIAYGIAQSVVEAGGEVILTYGSEASKKRLEPIAEELGVKTTLCCDVTKEDEMDAVFAEIEKKWGKLDFMVHSVAYSDKNELEGRVSNTTMSNFLNTMNISCYSLMALTKRARPLMVKAGGGSIITMSYLGGERVIPHYNVMGIAKAALECSVRYLAVDLGSDNIRINSMSSGPIKTLAAAGIGDFNYMLKYSEYNTPLKRNVTIEENGQTALYLLSDMSSSVTGENIHIDGGYHVVGMKDPLTPNLELPKKSEE